MGQSGIQLGYVDGGLVTDNIFKRETRLVWYDPPGPTPGSYIYVTRGGSGPALWYCTNVVIDPNIIQTDGVGIFLYSSSNILIESNIISAPDTTNPSDVGIHIQSCTNIDIIGNTIQNFTAGPKQYYTYGTTGADINVYVSKAINIRNNNLYNNTLGVLVQRLNLTNEPREVNIHYNNFEGNTEFGVLNCYSWVGKDKTYTPTNESFIVDARYNWWGHETGPYHGTSWTYMGSPYGPHYGLGDNVSDYVLYNPWLRTPFTPPPIHDVAIINVVPSATRVAIGTTIQVNVTAKNEGNTYETFDVSLYYNSHLISTQTITDLAPGTTKQLTFNWDTTGTTPGTDYTITAIASTVPGETDTADNTKSAIDKVRVGEPPLIKIEPQSYNVKKLGETFNVTVTINNLKVYWKVIGVNFRVTFNSTLLEVVNITEGSFMKQAGNTFFIKFVEIDPLFGANAMVGILILPPWNKFPEGDGTLATITFRYKYQERGEFPPRSCDIKLLWTKLFDNAKKEVPHTATRDYSYMAYPTNLCDLNYDLVVDITDVAMVAYSFGAYPGHLLWDPLCDLNNDQLVDIEDVAWVAYNFGWQTDP